MMKFGFGFVIVIIISFFISFSANGAEKEGCKRCPAPTAKQMEQSAAAAKRRQAAKDALEKRVEEAEAARLQLEGELARRTVAIPIKCNPPLVLRDSGLGKECVPGIIPEPVPPRAEKVFLPLPPPHCEGVIEMASDGHLYCRKKATALSYFVAGILGGLVGHTTGGPEGALLGGLGGIGCNLALDALRRRTYGGVPCGLVGIVGLLFQEKEKTPPGGGSTGGSTGGLPIGEPTGGSTGGLPIGEPTGGSTGGLPTGGPS